MDLVFLYMAPFLQRGSSLSSLIFLQDGLFHFVYRFGLLFKRACSMLIWSFVQASVFVLTGFSLQASVFVFISSFRRAWEADIGGTLLSRSEESSKIRSASTPFIFQPGVTNVRSNFHHPWVWSSLAFCRLWRLSGHCPNPPYFYGFVFWYRERLCRDVACFFSLQDVACSSSIPWNRARFSVIYNSNYTNQCLLTMMVVVVADSVLESHCCTIMEWDLIIIPINV